MPHRRRSILMLLLTMAIWGSTFVVTKEVIDGLPPLALAFVRVAVAALVLMPGVLARRSRETAGSRAAPLPWGTIWAMGFVGVAVYYALFNFALARTTASQGALVQSCIPAMTALVAVLWLREHASLLRWTGIALSIAGVAVVFSDAPTDGGKSTVVGNLLMFGTCMVWGLYTGLAKRTSQFDSVAVTAAVMAVGALLLLPLAAFEIAQYGVPRLSPAGWLGVLYLSVVASGVAYLLYNTALEHLDASQVGAFANLIPIVGIVTGVVVLGEPLSTRAIIGGLIVFLGVWVTGLQASSKSVPALACGGGAGRGRVDRSDVTRP